MITDFSCEKEGNVLVARWKKNGKAEHISTLASALSLQAFEEQVKIDLGLLPTPPDTPYVAAVKAGKVPERSWR